MNIFRRELKANLKSLIIWSGIVFLFTVVGFSKFSAYYNNPELLAILDTMPKALLAAFSMKAFNLSTITGFVGLMYTYNALMLCIAAVMWGSDIISREERDKTVEYSLTLPIPRSRLITWKTLTLVVNCVVLNLVAWGSITAMAVQYHPDSNFAPFVALTMVAIFVMQLIFLAIGVFLGAALKRYKQAGSLAVSVLLITYIFSVLTGLSKDLDFLKYFSPFKYFDPVQMLNTSEININYILLSVGIIVVCMIGAYVAYKKRDLYI
jgi:ABC-2 type transport system permease protein